MIRIIRLIKSIRIILKILFLTDDYPPYTWGGAGRIVYNLAGAFVKLGHQVFVVTTVREREKAGIIKTEDGVTINFLYSNYNERWRAYLSLYNSRAIRPLRNYLSEVQPDVIHAHNIHYHISYYSLVLARKFSSKVFLTFHDAMSVRYGKAWPGQKKCGNPQYDKSFLKDLWLVGFIRFNPFRNLAIKILLRKASHFFSVSSDLKNYLEAYGIGNISIVYNGLDINSVKPISVEEEFLKKYDLLRKKIMLLATRISHAKGAYISIDSLVEVKKVIPDIVLVFAGVPDSEREKLVLYAKKAGVEDLLKTFEWLSQDDLKKLFSASDLVLIPSIYLDPFPTVNLEAALYKKPVVATCFGGSKEFVVDGKTGYIVNPYDKQMFASKIIDILSNKERTIAFGQSALERLTKEFSLQKQVQELLRYYS